jgi:hypothetical protein
MNPCKRCCTLLVAQTWCMLSPWLGFSLLGMPHLPAASGDIFLKKIREYINNILLHQLMYIAIFYY